MNRVSTIKNTMNFNRIYAIFLRHLYPLKRDFDLWTDMAYWPIIDTILWGVTSQWLGEASGLSSILLTILTSLVLWNVVWRSQAEISRNLIDEIWNNNLVNIFSTPMTLREWIFSVISLSFIKTAVTMVILLPVIYLLYSINIFTSGWWLLVFYLNTALTGWWVGFVAAGIVIRWGPKVQAVVWTLPAVLIPFSAVYFPLSSLPIYISPISRMLPSTYVFEAMRLLIETGTINVPLMFLSFGLNIVYLGVAIYWFVVSFRKSVELGLSRFG